MVCSGCVSLQVDLQDDDLQVEDELVPWLKCHYDIAKMMKKHEQKRQELIKGTNGVICYTKLVVNIIGDLILLYCFYITSQNLCTLRGRT